MTINLIQQQIQLLARQLRIPTFGKYPEVLRSIDSSVSFEDTLLLLMKAEYEKRQENQNFRLLKQAGFPMTKSIEELDIARYDG